jgi:hypothetical protein
MRHVIHDTRISSGQWLRCDVTYGTVRLARVIRNKRDQRHIHVKNVGSPILKERASWHSIGTLFCLTIHITNSLWPYRVTTGSRVLAAIPNHREPVSTILVQHTTKIAGFYVLCLKQKGMVFGFRKTATAVIGPEIDRCLKQMKELYSFSSDTHVSPNKHVVHCTSNFHNFSEPTWSD